MMGGCRGLYKGHDTYHMLEVDEAESLAYVIAHDNQVGLEQPPGFGTRRIEKLKAILSLAGAYLKNEWLVDVSEKRDGNFALETLASLADSPERCQWEAEADT